MNKVNPVIILIVMIMKSKFADWKTHQQKFRKKSLLIFRKVMPNDTVEFF